MQTKQNTIVYKIATNKQKNEMMELAYSPGLSFEWNAARVALRSAHGILTPVILLNFTIFLNSFPRQLFATKPKSVWCMIIIDPTNAQLAQTMSPTVRPFRGALYVKA